MAYTNFTGNHVADAEGFGSYKLKKHWVENEECDHCLGSGKDDEGDKCEICKGSGQ